MQSRTVSVTLLLASAAALALASPLTTADQQNHSTVIKSLGFSYFNIDVQSIFIMYDVFGMLVHKTFTSNPFGWKRSLIHVLKILNFNIKKVKLGTFSRYCEYPFTTLTLAVRSEILTPVGSSDMNL